jgi:hypothetical protein
MLREVSVRKNMVLVGNTASKLTSCTKHTQHDVQEQLGPLVEMVTVTTKSFTQNVKSKAPR